MDRSTTVERHGERRRAASDDYVRLIRNQRLTAEQVESIRIPVKQAIDADPCMCFFEKLNNFYVIVY